MKIVFFGTPDFVIHVLERLHKEFKDHSGISPIVAVVTQKPKPVGRKKKITYSAVDNWAHKRNIPKYYNPKDLIVENVNANISVLAAYGSIITQDVLNHFPLGILNIHPSLLPRYRGASPIPAAIASGDTKTGVTIIKMDKQMDHGPIVAQFKLNIKDSDTSSALIDKSFRQSADMLIDLLPAYVSGKIKPKAQDHSKATFTTLLKKEHGFIPFNYLTATLQGESLQGVWKIPFVKDSSVRPSPSSLHNFIRAMDPWPIAWTRIQVNKEEKRLKILNAHIEGVKLVLDKVQLEGKNTVSWEQFIQAYQVF